MPRMTAVMLVSALAMASVSAAREQTAMTPTQKVIELLTGMSEKGKKEKHEEQVQFAAYKTWCDQTSASKQVAIKTANEQIEVLEADIEKAQADAEELGKEIAQHDEDTSTWQGDLTASTKVREIENGMYNDAHKDYTESIQALADGIAELKGQSGDTEQAAAPEEFVQKSSKVKSVLSKVTSAPIMTKEQKRAIEVFLGQDPDDDENLALAAPEAKAFEFHSQGIVDMLSKLEVKFVDERTDMENSETAALNSFQMLTMDLKNHIEQSISARTEKAEAKTKNLQAAAEAKGELEDTVASRDDDSKYLADLTSTCSAKADAFAERQTLRAEEIEAIEKAKEIIASGAVAGAAEKHLPTLLQKRAASLAQLRAAEPRNSAQLRVAAFLRDEATKLDSRVLSALALRVADDPFKKVKKMIKDLIVKLLESQNAEAEQKGWCDTEMASNEQTRNEKTSAVETLTAEIDELTGHIAKMTEEITELTQGVSDISQAVATATKIREEEKAKNAATVKDAQGAQTAIAQALVVLKDFYAKASEATSLVQQPAVFDEPYKGMGAESGGVVGMIEVIQSDFAKVESETTTAEAEGQKEYDEMIADSEVDKAQKKSDIEHKKTSKQNAESALSEKKSDLAGTQKELAAAMAYYDKLKPTCVDAGVSYEDRVARRKEEIESLQEALKILTAE